MTESNALPMPSHPAGSRRHYQTDGRERVLLVLALGLGFLTADLCLAMWYGVPALGVTLLVLLWEGTLLWYAREGTGLPEKAKRGAGLGLTVAVVLLGLCFSLCVSWLWLLNALALLALLVLQMFQLFGPARRAWSSPLMLAERGFLLLDGLTVRENILLPAIISGAVGHLTEARADQLCDVFGISAIRNKYPAEISGGEKQRISIARAIMKDAPIIILDEATANVDPENEAELQKAIEALTQGKTIIMIAHRLKTVKNADQIIVIDRGKISQQGTHDELIKQAGIYADFVGMREKAIGWKIKADSLA